MNHCPAHKGVHTKVIVFRQTTICANKIILDGYHLVRLDDRWSLTNTELIARPRQRRKRCTTAVKTARGETMDDEVEAAHNGRAATRNNVAAAACGGRSAGRGYNDDRKWTDGLEQRGGPAKR